MTTLTLIVFSPLLAAIGLAFVPGSYRVIMRAAAIGATFLTMLLAVVLFCRFNGAPADEYGYKFVSTLPWLGAESLDITCKFGVDGINVGLLLMGAIVAFAASLVSWEIRDREKEFYILLLVMTGGILGAFASLNLFYFYFLHELALIPTFIMIGVWGCGERKNYATFQITIYLGIGALLALIGLIALYIQAGIHSFDIPKLTEHFLRNPMAMGSQFWIFPLLMFGFGILVSLWPFHSWAPLGYASAPTATAMMHAGVIKKFGLYGLIRVAPMLPIGMDHWGETLALLALGNLLYCGLVAIRQKDLNLLVGNASVAHMGFVFLGIACLGFGDPKGQDGTILGCNSLREVALTGAVLVMIAHGLLAALTFGLTGYLRQQTGTLEMAQLGGLLKRMPFIGTALAMALFAGCGLPGFANFIGEVMVFFGAWKLMPEVVSVAAWSALIIGAVYMMRAIRNVLHGPPQDRWHGVADASAWRKIPFVLLLAALLLFGCLPGLLTGKIGFNAGSIVTASKGKTASMMLQFMSDDGTNAPVSTPSISPSR